MVSDWEHQYGKVLHIPRCEFNAYWIQFLKVSFFRVADNPKMQPERNVGRVSRYHSHFTPPNGKVSQVVERNRGPSTRRQLPTSAADRQQKSFSPLRFIAIHEIGETFNERQ